MDVSALGRGGRLLIRHTLLSTDSKRSFPEETLRVAEGMGWWQCGRRRAECVCSSAGSLSACKHGAWNALGDDVALWGSSLQKYRRR